jgi:hypothetical protein
LRLGILVLLTACHRKDDDTGSGFVPPVTSSLSCTTNDDCGKDQICGTVGVCGPTDGNDSSDVATPIEITPEPDSSGVINPPGDIDWWAYTSPGDEWIDVRTVTSGDRSGNLNTVVRAWKPDGRTEYAAMDDYATGQAAEYDSILRLYLPDPGTWYITVEDTSSYYTQIYGSADDLRGGADYSYQLWVQSYTAVDDENPDSQDSPAAEVDLTDGNTIYTFGVKFEEDGDSDWLALNLASSGQPLEVWSQPADVGSTADLEVRLYDASGTLLSDKSSVGPDGFLSYFDAAEGDYTVEALNASGDGDPAAWAVLYMRTYSPGDFHPFFADNEYLPEQEPNDASADATLVATVQETSDITYDAARFQGTLSLPGDLDSFAVEVGNGQEIHLRCYAEAFGSLADLKVVLLDPSGADATPADQGSSPTNGDYYLYNVAATQGGNWIFQVSSEDGTSGPQDYYRCSAYLTQKDIDPG